MKLVIKKIGLGILIFGLFIPGFITHASFNKVDLLKGHEAEKILETKPTRTPKEPKKGNIEEKIHPGLLKRLEVMNDDSIVTVAIWLPVSLENTSTRPDVSVGFGEEDQRPEMDVDTLQIEKIQKIQTKVAEVQHPILKALSEKGRTPIYVSPVAPLMYVKLSKSEVQNIAKRADVDMVYGPNQNVDQMDVAKETHNADVVDDMWGYDGIGIDVGILEDSRIEFGNPYLNSGTTRVPDDPNVDQHATAVAGIVASQHPTYQGIAQGVYLFSANATDYSDANLAAAMDWAVVDENVDILNNSWGTEMDDSGALNEHARHLDYIVRNIYTTVIVSAGDYGYSTEYVTNPGKGFNVLTVGSFNDQGTVTWNDDQMNSFSSWRDPDTSVGKPEVVASGSSITTTTDSSPWIDDVGSSTSWAAPIVAGEAALIMEGSDPSLVNYPETVKAIIMATAVHNLEGDSRLSEYDGVGGVDIRRAVRLAKDGPWVWKELEAGDFPYEKTHYLKKGELVRAVAVWNSNPSSDYSTDPLDADLDLYVEDPDGTPVADSLSSYNPYEIVEIRTEKSGEYTFRIEAFRFDGTIEYVGFAIWPGDRKTTADFDMDYDTDVSVFRPSNGKWYVKGEAAEWWGLPGDIPVPGDYDGDGSTDIAVFRPSNGKWYVKDGVTEWWGFSDDIPMQGDYDGDGDTDMTVFRPSNGKWYVKDGVTEWWGLPGDIPVPGDYDGDGSTDIAVYRPSNGKWYVKGGVTEWWGMSGDIPVPGDYDGDGSTDFAVYRPSNGKWFVKDGVTEWWGLSGDIPVPGDYDGDGGTDIAVLRPSNGKWYIKDQTSVWYYLPDDYPLPVRDTNADGDPYQ